MEGRRGHAHLPNSAVLEQLPGKKSPSIFKEGGRAKAEAKLSVRETVRNTTGRELVPWFPWDLWRRAMGTCEWKD